MPLNFNTSWVNNFPAPAQAPFNRALATWSNHLNSNVQIDVTAIWNVPLPGGLVAICVPNATENFTNAPLRDTWYPSALADKVANLDVQAADEDMTIFFAQNLQWNFHGPPAANEYDLESIALHELGHGLGFVSTYWVYRGWPYLGSYGNDALLSLINNVIQGTGQAAQLGFQLPPTLHGHPSVYGLHVQDLSGTALTDPGRYDNLSLGPALIGSNLFFDAGRTQLYAPNPFKPFTSIDHLNAPNSLMRPGIAAQQVVRVVDAPVLAIMEALGW